MKKISANDIQKIFLGKKSSVKESTEEDEIFFKAMKNVQPLKDNKKISNFEYKQLQPIKNPHFDFMENNISDNFKINLLSKKEILQIKNHKKRIESILDLHGKTTDESNILLNNFIKNSFLKGYRLVMIITGKGNNSTNKENNMGVLKAFFLSWLLREESLKYIVSYAIAGENHGGEGAFYIVLRKNRKL